MTTANELYGERRARIMDDLDLIHRYITEHKDAEQARDPENFNHAADLGEIAMLLKEVQAFLGVEEESGRKKNYAAMIGDWNRITSVLAVDEDDARQQIRTELGRPGRQSYLLAWKGDGERVVEITD